MDQGRYHSPELKKDAATALQKMTPFMVDMYMYGCLVYEIFNGPFRSQDELIKPRNIPQVITTLFKAVAHIDN